MPGTFPRFHPPPHCSGGDGSGEACQKGEGNGATASAQPPHCRPGAFVNPQPFVDNFMISNPIEISSN